MPFKMLMSDGSLLRAGNVPYAVDGSDRNHDDRKDTEFDGGFGDIAHSIPLMIEPRVSDGEPACYK